MNKNDKQLLIASRASPLAVWQAKKVQHLLSDIGFQSSLVTLKTTGDKMLTSSLANIGGKGLFTKELDIALLNNKVDLAVHSLKDLPTKMPQGIKIAAVCNRDFVEDVLITNKDVKECLLNASIIGTSSTRRKCLLEYFYPKILVQELRGNIQTRILKLDKGDLDAIVLCAASLERLGLKHRIKYRFPVDAFIPCPGQGVICVTCRSKDTDLINVLEKINHRETKICVEIERDILNKLQGNCTTPFGCYVNINSDGLIKAIACLGKDKKIKYASFSSFKKNEVIKNITNALFFQ